MPRHVTFAGMLLHPVVPKTRNDVESHTTEIAHWHSRYAVGTDGNKDETWDSHATASFYELRYSG